MKQDISDMITHMFNKINFDVTNVHVEMEKPGEYYINIESDDAPLLTMWNGDVLRALQHVISSMCRSRKFFEEEDARVKIDVGGYRRKQEESVIKMAEERVKRAIESKSTQILPPMSPYFRRLVHMHITENYTDLVTESSGEGDQRHIKIIVRTD